MCAGRGVTREAEELDHIIPLSDGGDDTEDNYQGLCKPCHKAKTKQENKRRY
jgi:5-methylcytosine-specific restriction protein A